jgi:hypothetical protein
MQIKMVTHPLTKSPGADADGAANTAARPAIPQARPAAADPAPWQMPNVWDNEVLRQLRQAVREADPTVPDLVRAELTLDKATSRIVVRVVEIGSEQVVRQYPSEETLRLLARVREQLGSLLSTTV